MKYHIRHANIYRYMQAVVTSFHRLHLSPQSCPGQRVTNHTLTVNAPNADPQLQNQVGRLRHEPDSFGNDCRSLEVILPYDELDITAWTEIEIDRQPLAGDNLGDLAGDKQTGQDIAWDQPPQTLEPAIEQFRYDSRHIRRHPVLADFARPFFPAGGPLLAGVTAFTQAIFETFTYDPQSTDIATAPRTVLETKRGVCQDFAHVAIAGLRSLGIAAAYVSGYLETKPPEGATRLIGADASHAWLCVHHPHLGWIHVDPTNGILIDNRHIITATGRDFADVSPVTGIIYGGGSQQLNIAVDVIPEDEWDGHPLQAQWPDEAPPA